VALLLAVGVLAGVVTGLSPCVLPVLPILAAGGAVGGGRWRPIGIVAGMVLTFSIVTLVGSSLLSFFGLPQDLLRDIGIAVLFVLGAGLVVPALGYIIERPFARLSPNRVTGSHNGLLLGASLGLVFVPCAGPVLAAITVVGATHRLGFESAALTLCYAIGAAVPLLIVAYLSRGAASKARSLRRRAPLLRQGAGLLIIASAAVIAFGIAQPLQRDLPGYTTALDSRIEGNSSITSSLDKISGEHVIARVASFGHDLPDASNTVLSDYGPAPRLLKITAWFNTPGDRPLTLAGLKGKVVLVDFWTYSCINCERTLPHLEAWYKTYAPYGLEIIGVHTPEFAFERVIGNVRRAIRSLAVNYPVAIDDSYTTWLSYGNQQWPAEYLIDQTGHLRYIKAGEGDYSQTESLIRDLLAAGGETLPPRTNVPNLTPTELTTAETYLGFLSSGLYAGPHIVLGKPKEYTFARDVPQNYVSLQGIWTSNADDLVSGGNAELRLRYQAKDVYLVLGGHGSLDIMLDGRSAGQVDVNGYPRNYAIIKSNHLTTSLLQLDMSPGISAYDFTFG
jgi:cytochrome c biogenesis protein CcdA/thiol-disulfide isomerase/thioredoxin